MYRTAVNYLDVVWCELENLYYKMRDGEIVKKEYVSFADANYSDWYPCLNMGKARRTRMMSTYVAGCFLRFSGEIMSHVRIAHASF